MLCTTSFPHLLFWGLVNTGFRLELLSVGRTIGQAAMKMLNVSIKSICLQRRKNRRFFCFLFRFFHIYFFIRKYKKIYFVIVVLHNQVVKPLLLWEKETGKKKNKFNQVITICDNQLLFAQLSSGRT